MAADFPNTQAWTRLPEIFKSISTAGTPAKFNNEFLKTTLGYASSNDRAIISILRRLGFISASGEPTQRYNDFKGHEGGRAIAAGLREGWAALFLADQGIFTKPVAEVQKRVTTITGANETVAYRVASTFAKLCEIADWSESGPAQQELSRTEGRSEGDAGDAADTGNAQAAGGAALRLHHDIHLHLPATSDAAVYRAIFQAIKSELT